MEHPMDAMCRCGDEYGSHLDGVCDEAGCGCREFRPTGTYACAYGTPAPVRISNAQPSGESTSARLARVEAELSGLRHDLAAAQQALADADQDRAELRDAVAERAEALQLAEAENATLRARLVRAHAQCALPDPSSRGSSS